jgi:GNAT superfamily N-acetyltransferase
MAGRAGLVISRLRLRKTSLTGRHEVIEVVEAELSLARHADALVMLMDGYALDPMGGGAGLSDYAKANLAAELRGRNGVHVILAFADGAPAGLAVCQEGFSTFACQPLLNIHDAFVTQSQRGKGLFKLMLQKIEAIAGALGCCKLTLEVLEGNHAAQAAYKVSGFAAYELDPRMGRALFWQKKL